MGARIAIAMWTSWEGQGLEHVRVAFGTHSTEAVGVVVRAHEEEPLRLDYCIVCDARGATRSISATVAGDDRAGVELQGDGHGGWIDASGGALPALDGCLDIDLSATPFTNTLAIRRLGLAVGESADLTVAYLPVPELVPRRVRQRYTRLSDRRFRYDALFREFSAELDLDDDDLVLDYPRMFRRAR